MKREIPLPSKKEPVSGLSVHWLRGVWMVTVVFVVVVVLVAFVVLVLAFCGVCFGLELI